MKAFLLHHAGGDKYAYLNMQQNLLPEVQAFAFELPGRSDRINEPFIKNIYDAVDDIYKQLLPHLQDNYCIVGNSMGAAVAYLLSHKLKQEKKTLPKHLFLASRLSPDAYKNEPNVIDISSADFWKVVQQYDGVPAQLLAHDELKEFYEPVLRNDFELLQQFNQTFETIETIDVPASILFGNKDVHNVDAEKMQGWRKFFSDEINILAFEGKHFFLYENNAVVNYIKSTLNFDR